MTQSIPTLNGIPALGYGTWPLKAAECTNSVLMALECGYRHIDTAQMYGNEAAVGAALRRSGLPRGGVFVVTKIAPENVGKRRFQQSLGRSLDDLGLDAVDLLLLHWPPRPDTAIDEAVDLLNEAVASKRTRMIGISNFNRRQMAQAVKRSAAKIVTNQVEYHPLIDQQAVREAAAGHGIVLTAYASIARGAVLDHPAIVGIASAHAVTPAAVVLRWIVDTGVVALAMTTKRQNAIGNLAAAEIALSTEEMAAITKITHGNKRLISPDAWAPDWTQ